MKKIFTSILTLCAAALLIPAGARERSVSEAQKVADGFKSGALTRSAKPSTLAYTAVSPSQGVPCFYVFNREEGGFVLVTADTELPDVIGYSAEGAFDYDKLPPSLKWWLSVYEKEIAAVYDGVASPMKRIATRAGNYVNIEPLVKTKWDQGAPYNNLCPLEGNTRAWTGCVATSTSQILNYHKYFKGSGSHTDIKSPTMSEDYSTLTINWDLMRNVYQGNQGPNAGTKEQRDEVAKLMKAVGVAVDMSYSKDGSGAYHQMVAHALRKYFGIAETATFVSRSWYTDNDWYDLVYNELKEGRPMVYGGASKNTAHSFVCDGYDVNGYFHMNWGWGGNFDGWFALTCLAPEGTGAGGGDGDYTLDQQAVIGIQAPAAGQKSANLLFGWPDNGDGTIGFQNENGSLDVFWVSPGTYNNQAQARGNINQVWQEDRVFDFQGTIYNDKGEQAGVATFYSYNFDTKAWDKGQKTMLKTFYWQNAQNLVWTPYNIWELDYEMPALPEGKYTLQTQYKLADSDDDWATVLWQQGMDGTIYFTVGADGKRTYISASDYAELAGEQIVESLEVTLKKEEGGTPSVKVGETFNMKDICNITVTPAELADKIVWQSWGTDILEITPDGQATAKGEGTVRITATSPDGKITASFLMTVGASTGVDSIESASEEVAVEARDGLITLSNVPEGSQVNVYSVAGVHVVSITGAGTVEVNVGAGGIYVVAVGDKRFKVRL